MSDDLVTVRISAAEALTLNRYGLLAQYLASQGIDTTRMHCTEDGAVLVYSSLPGKKGNQVTEENRVTKDNCGDGELR